MVSKYIPKDRKRHFTCGCVYSSENLKLTFIKGEARYRCPVHKMPMDYNIKVCAKCQKEFIIPLSTKGKVVYCLDCTDPVQLDLKRKKKKQKNETEAKRMQAAVDRCDCQFRTKCINDNINENFLPCLNCNRYVKEADLMPVHVNSWKNFDPSIYDNLP